MTVISVLVQHRQENASNSNITKTIFLRHKAIGPVKIRPSYLALDFQGTELMCSTEPSYFDVQSDPYRVLS